MVTYVTDFCEFLHALSRKGILEAYSVLQKENPNQATGILHVRESPGFTRRVGLYILSVRPSSRRRPYRISSQS